MTEKIIIGVLIFTTILFGGLYFKSNQSLPLRGTIGNDITSRVQFYDQATFSCARIYQLGATTNSSTTYYLVASTTAGGASVGAGFPTFVTSTKPTNC